MDSIVNYESILSLSDDIFIEILGFLDGNKGKKFNEINKYLNQIYKLYYKLYTYKNIYIRLNKKYSLKYHEDEEFRTLVRSRVENPRNQLSLSLSNCHNITDVSALGRVHTLDLSNCGNITDVWDLGTVTNLNLSGCTNITDVSNLDGVHTLNLSNCHNITDVYALGWGVHTLNLSGCTNITDVSTLDGVHTLNLSNCHNITDVSALDYVPNLTLP